MQSIAVGFTSACAESHPGPNSVLFIRNPIALDRGRDLLTFGRDADVLVVTPPADASVTWRISAVIMQFTAVGFTSACAESHPGPNSVLFIRNPIALDRCQLQVHCVVLSMHVSGSLGAEPLPLSLFDPVGDAGRDAAIGSS